MITQKYVERYERLGNPVAYSKPRLLNFILLNLKVRWPTGAAIVRPPNTEYTLNIGACWEKLPK